MSCKRCGRCCLEVGRTFWKPGNLNRRNPFGEIQALNNLAKNGDHEDGGLPCEMLAIIEGKAVCLIQRDYGYYAKPTACKEYPGAGELCFREEALATA